MGSHNPHSSRDGRWQQKQLLGAQRQDKPGGEWQSRPGRDGAKRSQFSAATAKAAADIASPLQWPDRPTESTAMDISKVFNSLLTWFADQLALLSNPVSASIGLAAIVPLLIAIVVRDRTATLVTALFALGAISVCATQEINWTLLAIFEATTALLLAFVATIRQRRSRAFHDEELHRIEGTH